MGGAEKRLQSWKMNVHDRVCMYYNLLPSFLDGWMIRSPYRYVLCIVSMVYVYDAVISLIGIVMEV